MKKIIFSLLMLSFFSGGAFSQDNVSKDKIRKLVESREANLDTELEKLESLEELLESAQKNATGYRIVKNIAGGASIITGATWLPLEGLHAMSWKKVNDRRPLKIWRTTLVVGLVTYIGTKIIINIKEKEMEKLKIDIAGIRENMAAEEKIISELNSLID